MERRLLITNVSPSPPQSQSSFFPPSFTLGFRGKEEELLSLFVSDEAACRAQPPSGPVIVLTEQSCHTYNLEKCDLGKETRWGLQLAIVTLLPKDENKGLADARE